MFDMLDDDIDIGYVPTMMNNSRSGGMKKLTKKEPKSVPKQPPPQPKNSKSNEFDDLLDDLLEKDSKPAVKAVENKSGTQANKNKYNDLDSYFDQPKSVSLDKTKQISPKINPVNNSFAKTSIFKSESVDQIIVEDHGFKSFGKTQLTITNQTKIDKVEETFVSSRQMKPPIRKKENPPSQTMNFSMGTQGLTIPEQDGTIGNSSSKNNDDDIIRPPPRLMNRRSSIDGKSQKNDEPLTLTLGITKSESPAHNDFHFDHKKDKKEETSKPHKQSLSLTLNDPPKIEKKQQPKPYIKPIEQPAKPIVKPEPKYEPQRKAYEMPVDQSITIVRDSPENTINYNKIAAADYEKQLEHMKATFQKQIDFLQDNLDKQISINRQTRDKLMRDSNKMIEEQRVRTRKVHEEQIKRLKDMFEWEKKRMDETYKGEINTLRTSLELANKTNSYTSKNTSSSNDSDYLEMQLKTQKRILQDRERILQKRQNDIEQRQIEMNKRKKKQEDRFRQEQKRILDMETKAKRVIMDEKKQLSEQKQQIAIQIANLELQVRRKGQKAEMSQKQNSLNQQSIQNQRNELRLMNAELMSKYRSKMQEVAMQKTKLKNIEDELVKKLRIVELKSKEVSIQQSANANNPNKTVFVKRQTNNWVDDKDKSHSNLRSATIEKQHDKSMGNIEKTKDRFNQIQMQTRNKLNLSVKQNKKFDLDHYIMNVQQYNKIKGDA